MLNYQRVPWFTYEKWWFSRRQSSTGGPSPVRYSWGSPEFLLVPPSASVARSSWSPCPMLLQSLLFVGKNTQNLSMLVVGQVSYPIAGRLQQIPYQLLLGWFIKLHHAKSINTWGGPIIPPPSMPPWNIFKIFRYSWTLFWKSILIRCLRME